MNTNNQQPLPWLEILSPEGRRNHLECRRLLREQYERDRRALATRLYREFAEQRVQAAQQEAQL